MTSAGPDLTAPGIHLLTENTPNGLKVSILLEELKARGSIPYYITVPISFAKHEQKDPWFLAVNPNGRIPALRDNRIGEKSINVWESASIMMYLVQTYDTKFDFHFEDKDEQTEMMNWVWFTQGGLGPMQGQSNHFYRYAPVKLEYPIKRYADETRRLFSVYETQLAGKDYLCGPGKGKFSIADMVSYPWARIHDWSNVSIEDFPLLSAWIDRCEARPGVKAGLKVPTQDSITLQRENPELAAEKAKTASAWIMAGLAKEAEVLAAKKAADAARL